MSNQTRQLAAIILARRSATKEGSSILYGLPAGRLVHGIDGK